MIKTPSKALCLSIAKKTFEDQASFGERYWDWLFMWGWHEHWVENYWNKE
jgi:hypothetical protein